MSLLTLQQLFNNVYNATKELLKVKNRSTNTIQEGSIQVQTTETELKAGASALANRIKLRIKCVGDDSIYIGSTGVTTSTGYPLIPGQEKVFEFDPDTETNIYAIASTNQTAKIIEEAI